MFTKSTHFPLFSPKFLLLLIFILMVLASFSGQMHEDEGIYSYVGKVWTQENMAPYLNTVENKTPGIFMVYAISNIIFGPNIIFIRGVGILFLCITAFLVYLISKKLHSQNAAIISMIIYGLIVSWKRFGGAYTSLTETYMAFFAIGALYFLITGINKQKWKLWLLIAGSFMGFAIAFKQTAILDAVALIIFFLLYNRKSSSNILGSSGVLLLIAGILLGTALSIIPLLISNVPFSDYINGAWLTLLNSGSYASLSTRITYFLTVWLTSRITIFYPFLFLFIFQLEIFKTRYFLGLSIWLLFDFIGVNSSGTYWGHQFKQMLPSLSIILGILISNTLMKFHSNGEQSKKYFNRVIIALIVMLFPFLQLTNNLQWWIQGDRIDHQKEIGLWLNENTDTGDYINLVGGGNPILAYSNRLSASKYFNSIYLTIDSNIDEFLNDLDKNEPVFLIEGWYEPDVPVKIQKFIDNNYYHIDTKYGFNIFKKLD